MTRCKNVIVGFYPFATLTIHVQLTSDLTGHWIRAGDVCVCVCVCVCVWC